MELPGRDPEVLLTYDGFVRALARSLVADGQRAEDVAQETWTAALAEGPRDRRSLRAWLGSLVRNLASNLERGERSRLRRERAVARGEAIPSAEEILQREDARRSVVRAVLELEEPYRSTVLLRYFENLPPRAIARRLGVPVETVRTRTKRALEQLRTRLDREHGRSRSAWGSALAALAALEPAVPLALAAPAGAAMAGVFTQGVLLVSTKMKLALAGVLLLGSSIAVWGLGLGPWPALPETGAGAADLAAAAAEADARTGSARSTAPMVEPALRRAATAPDPASRTTAPATVGSLRVRLVWAADKSPAADLGVRVIAWGGPNPRSEPFDVVSGSDGAFELAAVPAGKVSLIADRGGMAAATVEPGKLTETTFEIPAGFTVLGTVVDAASAPVAGADIWLSDFSGALENGRVVGRAAADGTFRIRDVGNGHYIGARASGFAPSPAWHLVGSAGGSLQVRIALSDPAGSVAGIVLDPQGRPVVSAAVLIGAATTLRAFKLADGSSATGPVPLEARTGADGRFLVRGVRTDKVAVQVRARKLAPWQGSADVGAGATVFIEVRLAPGVTLSGTVKDAAGEPVPRAEVGAGGHGFAACEAFTNAAGEFRLEALAAGEITVRVEAARKGKAEKTFTAANEDLRWDVVLGTGLELRGRVLETSGAPLAGWSVAIESDSGRKEDYVHGRSETDAQGRFGVLDCKDVPLKLAAYDPKGNHFFPALTQRGVRAGGAEVVLRIPAEARASAFITGVVVDAEDKPIGSASISPWSTAHNQAPILTSEEGTGRFRIGPITPGTYRLTFKAGAFPELRTEEHELGPGATWDLGGVRLLAGGTVAVTVTTEDGAAVLTDVWLAAQASERGVSAPIQLEQGKGRSEALAPGKYLLLVTGTAIAWDAIPFAIASGRETKLERVVRPGIRKAIRLEEPDGATDARTLQLTVRDGSGRLVIESMLWRRAGEPFATAPCFRPGEYRLEASMASGKRGAAVFKVAANEPREPVVIELR